MATDSKVCAWKPCSQAFAKKRGKQWRKKKYCCSQHQENANNERQNAKRIKAAKLKPVKKNKFKQDCLMGRYTVKNPTIIDFLRQRI